MPYTPTIGLEIHAELATATKMFCDSPNDPHASAPNTNICPVCLAHPGTLPVINREAVRQVLRVGTALGGTLGDFSEFDRKNYFYPDLPKGYQISQYQHPLVKGGTLAGVAITRIHLEEDTARSQHVGGSSIIDFNRAGVPLMELVTDPVIHDAETAQQFAQELQLLLRTLGASQANMEKGEMRVEANISVSADPKKLGTKVEVKNLNSFRSVGRAIAYEIGRHITALERGTMLVQETRGWDETRGITFSQRIKEDSHDYRYFPDPDLPKLRRSSLPEFSDEALKRSLPELPADRRRRYTLLGIKPHDIETLVADPMYSAFFDAEILPLSQPEKILVAVNYLITDVRGLSPASADIARISNGIFANLMSLVHERKISSHAAKTLLPILLKEGGDPHALASSLGLIQIHDTATLNSIVHEILQEHQKIAEEIRGGKQEAVRFLIGQAMKRSKGSANPQEIEKILKTELGM